MAEARAAALRVRQAARWAVDTARAAWVALARWPGVAYASLYRAGGLNRVLHAAGLSPQAQAAWIPRQLEVDPAMMSVPYWFALDAIRWGGRPPGGERRKGRRGRGAGLVHGGDWDRSDREPIDRYLEHYIYSRAVLEVFRDGRPYQDTEQFAEMMRMVAAGDSASWQARGCRTAEDVHDHFRQMRQTFEAIRDRGYRSQAELGTGRWFDEIKVYVGRDGEIMKLQGAGHHRLAMARVIGVPAVPVVVLGVHLDWAIRMAEQHGTDILSAVDRGLLQMGARAGPAGATSAGR